MGATLCIFESFADTFEIMIRTKFCDCLGNLPPSVFCSLATIALYTLALRLLTELISYSDPVGYKTIIKRLRNKLRCHLLEIRKAYPFSCSWGHKTLFARCLISRKYRVPIICERKIDFSEIETCEISKWRELSPQSEIGSLAANLVTGSKWLSMKLLIWPKPFRGSPPVL